MKPLQALRIMQHFKGSYIYTVGCPAAGQHSALMLLGLSGLTGYIEVAIQMLHGHP